MSADRIDPITAMKNANERGPCPIDCQDQRHGPHWHNYLAALKDAGFAIVDRQALNALAESAGYAADNHTPDRGEVAR